MMKSKFLVITLFCLGILFMAFADDESVKQSAQLQAGPSAIMPASAQHTDSSGLLTDSNGSRTRIAAIPNLYETGVGRVRKVKLNPQAVSFVQDYMESHGKELLKMKTWARPYFNMMDGILKKYGLPVELRYLAVIESKLKPTAVSWAGAVGPWQLMPETARLLGLKVNHKVDERTNYAKSTNAAALYLRDLYNEFGDWLLVIAAYNGGPGNVYAAIRKSGSRNFWVLQRYLPNETRNHVKKFIGTHYVFEGTGGITTLTKSETADQLAAVSQIMARGNLSPEELANTRSIRVSGKYFSSVIARYVLMSEEEFDRYNPNFDRVMASANNSYDLKLPSGKMDLFISNKYQILNESVQTLLNNATVSAGPAILENK
ncbi:MAG TPA: lytic transglycosylase domain-containing protein [Chitinophagaceae bacterium]|nr:lytic transglycosylase domain-containing protein [Chitinophagaceae bacterium]